MDGTPLSVERFNPVLGSLADMQLTERKTSKPPCSVVPPKPKSKQGKATGLTEVVDIDLYRYLEKTAAAQLSLALKDPQPKMKMADGSIHLIFSSQDAKKHFLRNVNDYKCEIVPVNLDILNHGLQEEMKDIISAFSSARSVVFLVRYNEGFVKIVGRASPVFDRAINEVKNCIAKVEKRLRQRKDFVQILPVHDRLLQGHQPFKGRFKQQPETFYISWCSLVKMMFMARLAEHWVSIPIVEISSKDHTYWPDLVPQLG